MRDVVEVVKQVGYALDIGYWMIDLERGVAYWPRGLGRPKSDVGERGYHASSLDRLVERVEPTDQGRFRGFLGAVLAGATDASVELAYNATWGKRIHLRVAGRRVGSGRDAKIVGLVEVTDHWIEQERLAKNLAFIVEALFISSDVGIVIFDDRLEVRRLNRNVLELFGVSDEEESSGDWAAVIEKRLPESTRELLLEAQANSSAVSGTLSIGGLGGPRLTWRANPWGDRLGEMSGLVVTFAAKRPARHAEIAERAALVADTDGEGAAVAEIVVPQLPPEPKAPPPEAEIRSRHRALEWVKNPILLISVTTGEIAFANRAGRDRFRLPADRRSFVENLYDVSGFACDVDPLAVAAAGGHALRLRLGARVGRMLDYDADLLFVEYHDAATLPHPNALTRAELAMVARRHKTDGGRPLSPASSRAKTEG